MSANWKDVRRASIPVGDLPVLAELRGRGEIRILIAGEVAWISWKPGSELTESLLVRRILPLDEAVVYTERDGRWYRFGEHLPAFDVPGGDASEWPLLERAIFPEPVRPVQSRERLQAPIPIRVVRDGVSAPRPASGLRCSTFSLAAWAEHATSAQLAALVGAWLESEDLVLLTGSGESLPLMPDGLRFWGTELMVPLGFRIEPDLPASAIRHAAGARADELAVMDEDGIELIPHSIFKPLSRAAIRMIGVGGCHDWGGLRMKFERAALYLRIPESYCQSMGGLRWAHYGDAVEFVEGEASGQTFAFAPEIALFMEGLRDLEGGFPAFGHVLHLLYLIGLGDRAGSKDGGRRTEGGGRRTEDGGRRTEGGSDRVSWAEGGGRRAEEGYRRTEDGGRRAEGGGRRTEDGGRRAEDRASWTEEGSGVGVPGGCLERVAHQFRQEGCPLRNAGALCASLGADAPRAADPPKLSEIHDFLTEGHWVPSIVLAQAITGAVPLAEEPGLDPKQFRTLIRRRLALLDDEEIRHWLRHGRGPAGGDIDHLLPVSPKSVSRAFSEIERRPRLAGTLALASRLEAVLSIPSRRLDRRELEGGGYTDITTRGAPERILPIQFALDDEEFLRRFAERELLFFHREEFREPLTEELVILLDQGVRTWGDVRLLLSAAVVALVRQAERRRIAVKLAATSSGGELFDPTVIEPGALHALIEASDLSPHPGEALEAVMAAPGAGRRDVVLLTHPRSLIEPEVAAAARTGGGDGSGETRLFAVVVDSKGQLELAELRRGLPIVLARSRIEPGPAPAILPGHSFTPRQGPPPAWKGEFEPIGFPFSCGRLDILERSDELAVLAAQSFDFDESGERVLVVGKSHLMFTCRLDGTEFEHLPLPMLDGQTIVPERKVTGVAGGFVVASYRLGRSALVHYDFPSRTCVVHRTEAVKPACDWTYFRDLHAIALRPRGAIDRCVAIDLSATGSEATNTSRARRAAERARAGEQPYPLLDQPFWTTESEAWVDLSLQVLRLDGDSGLLHYRLGPDVKKSVLPLTDGEPALKGGQVVRADRGGDVLAVLVSGGAVPGLYFISTSSATVIGVFRPGEAGELKTFALSRDGKRFAVLSTAGDLEIHEVSGPDTAVFVAPKEEVVIHFVSLGRSCLLIRETEEKAMLSATVA